MDASKKPICVFQVHAHKRGCVWVLGLLLRMSSSWCSCVGVNTCALELECVCVSLCMCAEVRMNRREYVMIYACPCAWYVHGVMSRGLIRWAGSGRAVQMRGCVPGWWEGSGREPGDTVCSGWCF